MALLVWVVAARCGALLQIHGRLAGAVLKNAVDRAVVERDRYLSEADRLLQAAEAIDGDLKKLSGVAPVTRSPLEALESRGKLKRIVELESLEAPKLEPLAAADLGDAPRLWLLASDTEAALALPNGLVLALKDETVARQIAHLLTDLEGFPLRSVKTNIDDILRIIDTTDGTLGVIL